MIDVIVVGSGPGGVNAAYPLCEAGLNVLMLDFGNTDKKYRQLVPSEDFTQIRLTDNRQYRYFLGDEYEGILLGNIRVGTKLTPPRLHVVADSAELMPVDSDTFVANESLALGGLADSWGAGVFPFRDEDFLNMPFSLSDLNQHYRNVAERIGISGGSDDLSSLFGEHDFIMPPLNIDSNAEKVLNRYKRLKRRLNDKGFFMGRAPLAVCSRPYRGRDAHQYHDMDYWTDTDSSVYRPRYTVEELKRFSNFTYINERFVHSFRERDDNLVDITAGVGKGSRKEAYTARAVVLSAGTMGSARIALRSLNKYDVRIPILTNSYTYIPSINVNMLGQTPRDRRSSLSQLSAIYFPDSSRKWPVLSNFFSYRSLLTFKLLKESPLPQRECLKIMRALMPLFAIITIFHRDCPSPSKYCVLQKSDGSGPDRLEIQYRISGEELRVIETNEKAVKGFYRKLGCWPIKAIRRAPGSSIHYSGTLPMSKDERELTCTAEGRLHGTRSVYVADGSVISPLPSIVPTFTIMAIADRTGKLLAQKLKS
jgi:choline dehydrogenase-like flavoprotein